MNKVIYFTPQGLEEKKNEYEKLLLSRPDAVKELSKAREMGDLSENGYYKSAKFKLSDIDRKLRQLKFLLKIARVKESVTTGRVDIGSTVTISDGTTEKTYQIVGSYESNPSEGKISLDSPLGKALAGKRQNDVVNFKIGDQTKELHIVATTNDL